jgi:hypothetical protein
MKEEAGLAFVTVVSLLLRNMIGVAKTDVCIDHFKRSICAARHAGLGADSRCNRGSGLAVRPLISDTFFLPIFRQH